MEILNKQAGSGPLFSILNKQHATFKLPPDVPPTTKPETPARDARGWLKEIKSAEDREKDYQKTAKEISELYETEKKADYQYNILFSNTETMIPALYNVTPRPVVQRRYQDKDPLAMAASEVVSRALGYFIDDGRADYATFDSLMADAVQSALVPGRGVTFFRFDARVPEAMPDVGEAPEAPQVEAVEDEVVYGENITYDRFLHGYAKSWETVPWVAVKHEMTKEELRENFKDLAEKVVETMGGDDSDTRDSRDEDEKRPPTAVVYEIWDKPTAKVYFVAKEYPDAILRAVEDPYKLSGFFPCPKPLMFLKRVKSLLPLPPFQTYREQAKELNNISVRINALVKALRLRGGYDQSVSGLDKVLAAGDNEMIAMDNVPALIAAGQNLEKALFFIPIEKLTGILQQLYLQREQIKSVIYEITGVADIMRGSSQASETLGAQKLKNQWGTLRLKRSQKEVSRYCRDSLRIMSELVVENFSQQRLQELTLLPYPTQAEQQQLAMQYQQQVQAAQQAAAMQPPGMPGQPPQQPPAPPPQPPELQQPPWEAILAELRDNLKRSFHIRIETNSTVDAEATEDKQNIGELLNALAQFLNGVQPLVEAGSLPFEAAQGMMLTIVRRYRFGPELEDQLSKMHPPQPKADPKAQSDKIAAETAQMEAQTKQKELQLKAQMDQATHLAKMQEMAQQQEMAREKHSMEMQKLQATHLAQMASITQQMKAAQARPAPAARPKGK